MVLMVVTWFEYLPHNPTEATNGLKIYINVVPNLFDFLLWDRKDDILETQ